MSNVGELGQRLQHIKTELEVLKRNRYAQAEKIVKVLSGISDEDMSMLSKIVPDIVVIKGYTVEDIFNNSNGELNQIIQVRESLRRQLESRLSYYEDCINES